MRAPSYWVEPVSNQNNGVAYIWVIVPGMIEKILVCYHWGLETHLSTTSTHIFGVTPDCMSIYHRPCYIHGDKWPDQSM